MKKLLSLRLGLVALLVIAVAVNLAFGLATGLIKPMTSDAHYYLQAAQSLAEGRGYRIHDTFWPDSLTMTRSPGWPFLVSLALRLFHATSPDAVMRCLCLFVNALTAGGVFLLAHRLFSRLSVAWVAGLGYAVHPVALYLACDADSEPLFVFLLVAGFLLLLRGRGNATDSARPSLFCCSGFSLRASAFFVLGLACTVRPNLVLWIGALALVLLIESLFSRHSPGWTAPSLARPHAGAGTASQHLRLTGLCGAILCAFLFAAPSLFWAARNYRICGHFPVLSTIGGQTFYGGNNEIVTRDFKYWGYWIFANDIPGEKTMEELAKTRSEYDLDRYYYSQGKAYVSQHLSSMPWLELGKLVRAYVPVPWNLTGGTAVVSGFRWILYGAALIGIFRFWKRVDQMFRSAFLALLLTNVATVLVYWGCARFAFPLDPFLLPFAAASIRRL